MTDREELAAVLAELADDVGRVVDAAWRREVSARLDSLEAKVAALSPPGQAGEPATYDFFPVRPPRPRRRGPQVPPGAYSVRQVAEQLGVSASTVRNLIRQGQLQRAPTCLGYVCLWGRSSGLWPHGTRADLVSSNGNSQNYEALTPLTP